MIQLGNKKFANTLTDIYLVVIRYLGSVYLHFCLAFIAGSLFVDCIVSALTAQRARCMVSLRSCVL